ncbi:MAG: polysaccharide deacetylase family protein [Syntrophomonadaceae bacterium]|nr:polysaccharide deacetylase family protein [Syntrophomonadaceae bacterium]
MRVYFISKKKLIGAAAVLVLIFSFLGFSLVYYNESGIASRMTEPIYQGNTGKKLVAITVNVDWGEEYIPSMLEQFAKHDAKVTFFVTGVWAEKNPDLLKKMAEAGHSIQNHGYKHVHFNSLSQKEAIEQIKKAEEVIYNITGKRSEFFASPYGEQNRQLMMAVSSINYDLIMWSIDTIDWQRPSPETIVKRVLNKIHNDAIILMHPTEPTVQALPEMLGNIAEQGYKMVTIDKILVGQDEGKAEDEDVKKN